MSWWCGWSCWSACHCCRAFAYDVHSPEIRWRQPHGFGKLKKLRHPLRKPDLVSMISGFSPSSVDV